MFTSFNCKCPSSRPKAWTGQLLQAKPPFNKIVSDVNLWGEVGEVLHF